MKKVFVIICALGLLSLGSCKKNYSCTCDGPGIKDPEVSNWKLNEEDAKANCSSLNAVHQEDGGSCVLTPD
ncbi:MAG: hypothetical protein ACI857_003217 [Arenicella sp.]|jgi:hypothetical protein